MGHPEATAAAAATNTTVEIPEVDATALSGNTRT
jgi:hypothetical protein